MYNESLNDMSSNSNRWQGTLARSRRDLKSISCIFPVIIIINFIVLYRTAWLSSDMSTYTWLQVYYLIKNSLYVVVSNNDMIVVIKAIFAFYAPFVGSVFVASAASGYSQFHSLIIDQPCR